MFLHMRIETCTYAFRPLTVLVLLLVMHSHLGAVAAEPWLVGFGKVEITPTEPVRLSGYASRDKPHTGVADPLFARAMVLTDWSNQPAGTRPTEKQVGERTKILISIDSIAVVGAMTQQIAERLQREYELSRADFVICSTHSHAAPHAASGLSNLYRTPLTADEQAAIERHAGHVSEGIMKAIAQAMKSREPAHLERSQTEAGFAANRRVLKGGLWTGFGIQADGPVDRRVQLLRAVTADNKLLGAVFLYACHCTTLGPNFNEVSADWAGLSATELEAKHKDTVFLPVIGCGADANPEPRTGYEDARRHGAEMAGNIARALDKAEWKSLKTFPEGHFGYAGLAPELPTKAELEAARTDKDSAKRQWAESMLATLAKMGRLPETYPAPIHTWSFGKDLLMVFLGGEVVVDYQLRLEKSLPADNVWVAAYSDDVFAYVASERMRAEGGYEVDFSMIYYNQPGRWQSGTEGLIERRVKEILAEPQPDDRPRNAQDALKSIHVPVGYQVDLIAAEPLVNDCINISFGHDGRVWVTEMSDYPLGVEGGGRIRWLRDVNGDGAMDESKVFLSGLNYPSSVMPWRNGVIIITAPAIFFAADTDGDGVCDQREELLQGIAEANPQHRASGFEMGLDGWLNFTSGDNTQILKSPHSGQATNVSGRDVRWHPDTGEFNTTTGHTQYIRARDEFNNWFGNVNNQPMFHYAIEDAYRRRPGLSGAAYQHLLTPAVAPPVYPFSRTQDRFNDLVTFNRFTSACGSIICRVPGLGPEMRGAALVCEPVHNLVARFRVSPDGASFVAERFPEDQKIDFFASSDPFSRPTRVINAPDGTLWVVDMVRQVIEHPQWIPTSWQNRLNLRSGEGLGRIYRVHRKDYTPTALPIIDSMSDTQLLKLLESDNAVLRDMAEQQLLWRYTSVRKFEVPKSVPSGPAPSSVLRSVELLAVTADKPEVRAQALGTLVGLSQLTDATLANCLKDKDPRVRRFAVVIAERWWRGKSIDREQLKVVTEVAGNEQDPGVLLQLALSLSLGSSDAQSESSFASVLATIASRAANNLWLAKALALTSDRDSDAVLGGVLRSLEQSGTDLTPARAALEQTTGVLWSRLDASQQSALLENYFPKSADSKINKEKTSLGALQVLLLTAVAGSSIDQVTTNAELRGRISSAIEQGLSRLFDEKAPPTERLRLVPLLALSPGGKNETLAGVVRLLRPQETTQVHSAALNVARKLRADETASMLLARWPEMLPEVRSNVCTLLLERPNWGEKLVESLEQGSVKVTDLDVAIIDRLRTYGGRNMIARSERVLGQPPNKDRAGVISQFMAALPAKGNLAQGELQFTQHCAVCHRATPDKPIVGPPLENISNWTREQWVIAILDPSRAIEPKYHQYAVVTKDGQTLSGLIEERSTHQLTLAAADGKRYEIELAEIETLKDLGVSLMPEGLETKLTPVALADLLEYVQTLRVNR